MCRALLPSILFVVCHLILPTALWDRYMFPVETPREKNKDTCSQLQCSQDWRWGGLRPSQSGSSQAHSIPHCPAPVSRCAFVFDATLSHLLPAFVGALGVRDCGWELVLGPSSPQSLRHVWWGAVYSSVVHVDELGFYCLRFTLMKTKFYI